MLYPLVPVEIHPTLKVPVSTYKFSRCISVHYFEELLIIEHTQDMKKGVSNWSWLLENVTIQTLYGS